MFFMSQNDKTDRKKRKELKFKTIAMFKAREDFVIDYLKDDKISKTYYRKLTNGIIEMGNYFDENIGYCGGGDSSYKCESLSSILVPDPEAKNRCCYTHDRLEDLRILTNNKLLTSYEVKRFFEAFCKYDEEGIVDKIETPLYVFFGSIALKFKSWFV